jgi:hypothetical protein
MTLYIGGKYIIGYDHAISNLGIRIINLDDHEAK